MASLVVLLSVVGAALPSLGVFRVYRRARSIERKRRALVASRGGAVYATYDDVEEFWRRLHAPTDRVRIAALDVALVFAGLACTAAASILGLVAARPCPPWSTPLSRPPRGPSS
ncbi:hypothetical protein [Cellulomonas septica]|uniref:CNNM transmembrane domain-containing protein n=1 Tax=Cellulomonas septica TaxID=285080 RepID=A0ABX1JUR1_9CELL|nr:hypothetical protein [Cellulomonas septica]NKY38048.1 hypothetical protein [Cellulomonas septica]